MSSGADSASGFHGKLVTKGDFVTRRLARGFLDPWDSWLQDVIGGSRARMGEAWLDAYLTSPIWRFVLSAGLCGDTAAAGVLMPSVDRVGRYFPLSIVAMLPAGVDPLGVPAAASAWFAEAEAIARSALEDTLDFEAFDAQVAALGTPTPEEPTPLSSGDGGARTGAEAGLRLSIPSADAVDGAYRRLAGRFLAENHPGCSLWWTSGSELVEPTFLVCDGLPPVESFGAFLDGRWSEWGWLGGASAASAAEARH
jgi:type VI secretion system protein ImpM